MRTLFAFFLFIASGLWSIDKALILVSVPPYLNVAKELIQDEGRMESVVPPGVSFHDYEPTPQAVLRLLKAKVWFTVEDPFEEKLLRAMQEAGATPRIVDLRKGIGLGDEASHYGHDPHIWMSPRMMKKELFLMKEALQELFPTDKDEIEKRWLSLQEKLDLLIEEMDKKLLPMKGKTILVSHEAYGFLCSEYGMKELSIEQEGKEPTLKGLHEVIETAKKLHIHTVFTQPDYPQKSAEVVAHEISAKIVELNPTGQDYFASMRKIMWAFSLEKDAE